MRRTSRFGGKSIRQTQSIRRATGLVLSGLLWPNPAHAAYNYVNAVDDFSDPLFNGGALSDPNINNNGTVAFNGEYYVGNQLVDGLYTTPSTGGGPITKIVDDSGTYSNISYYPALNDKGQVAFTATLTTGGSGVFSGNGATTTPVYLSSASGPFSGFVSPLDHPALNSGGTVAFAAGYNYGYHGVDTFSGVFAGAGGSSYLDIWDGSQGGPGNGGSPSINKNGVVVFGSSTGISEGIGTGPAQVLVSAGSEFKSFDTLPTINANGQVAFLATQLTAGGSGVFVDTNGTLDQIASASGSNATGYQSLGDPVINASGEAAFYGFAYNSAGGYDVTGIYTGNDPVADKVIATGDPLFGSTVQGIGSFLGINDAGQVAFSYSMVNGDAGIGVASLAQALTWTDAAGNGLWDTTSSNWNNGSSTTTFANGAQVTFNDSNGGHYAVALNTTVTPAAIVVNNSSGNYIISGTGAIAGAASLTKSGTGLLTIDAKGSSFGAVTINSGTVILGASTGLATMTALSISGNGALDINNNHVVIDYNAYYLDPIASIAALLATGYNGGKWNGPGIISSAAAANSGYGLGYADSADIGNPAGLASGTIEIKYTLLGDANLDGVVNAVDFGILAANFNKGVTGWDQGDFNYDNVVSAIDFGDLAANFNKGASGISIGPGALSDPALVAFAQANGLMADVPEPGLTLLLPLLAGALIRRRRESR